MYLQQVQADESRTYGAVHVGLRKTSIGPSSLAKILCSINTPPHISNTGRHTVSGMQKTANLVLESVIEENKKDMPLRYQDLQLLNNIRRKNPASVNIQADG